MFFPHPKSLLYADSLLPQGLLALVGAGPRAGRWRWPTTSSSSLTFPRGGLGAMLLARELGASRGRGAFLAGFGFAFCTYRWDHLVHVQSLSVAWLPFGLCSSACGPLRRPAFGVAPWGGRLRAGFRS